MEERIPCSCGGENERCFRCDGRGWYEEADPDRPLKVPGADYASLSAKAVRKKSALKQEDKGSRRRVILSKDPLPPNRDSDTRPKRPIKTLASAKLRPAGTDTYKPRWAVLRLRFRKNSFSCRFDAKRIKAADLPLLAGKALARLLRDTDGAFLKRSTILSMRIPNLGRAQVFVIADQIREEKHDLVFAGITAWVRVVSDQPVVQRKDERKPVKKRRDHEASGSVHQSGATGRVSPREGNRLEREQDATRDYWQLRDHGQFGSHPSHDDYDS